MIGAMRGCATVLVVLVGLSACVSDPTATDLSGSDLAASDLGVTIEDLSVIDATGVAGDLTVAQDGAVSLPNFVPLNEGLWGGEIVDIEPRAASILYALGTRDLYHTDNGGLAWQRLPNAPPMSLPEEYTALGGSGQLCLGTSLGRIFCAADPATGTYSELTGPGDLGTPPGGKILEIVPLGTNDLLVATATQLLRWDGVAFAAYDTGLPTTGSNRGLFRAKQATETAWLVRSTGIYYRAAADSAWTSVSTESASRWSFASTIATTQLPYVDLVNTLTLLSGTKGATSLECSAPSVYPYALGISETGILVRRLTSEYQRAGSCKGTWATIDTDVSSEILSFVAYGQTLWGVGEKGVFRWDATSTAAMNLASTGIAAPSVTTFAATTARPNITLIGSSAGLFEHNHQTGLTTRVALPSGSFQRVTELHFSPFSPQLGVAVIEGNSLHITTDGGQSWGPKIAGSVSSFAFDPTADRALACRTGTLYETLNRGESWNLVAPDGGTTGLTSCARVIAHPSPNIFFVAATSGHVWRSEDGGLTWSELAAGQLPSISATSLSIDPADPTTVYLGLINSGVVRVTASAATQFGPFNGKTVQLTRDPLQPSLIYAAYEGGVRVSSDNGSNWTTLTGLTDDYQAIFVHPSDRRHRWLGVRARGALYSFGEFLP